MRGILAASALAAVTLGVTLGTIWTAGEARASCPLDGRCPSPEVVEAIRRAESLEGHTERFLFRLEQGFQHLAGLPSQPQ